MAPFLNAGLALALAKLGRSEEARRPLERSRRATLVPDGADPRHSPAPVSMPSTAG